MEQINEFLNNPLVIIALMFLGAVLVFLFFHGRRRPIIAKAPPAPSARDLSYMALKAFKDAGEIRSSEIMLDRYSEEVAEEFTGSFAKAMRKRRREPCDFVQDVMEIAEFHRNPTPPPNCAEQAKQLGAK